MKNKKTILMNTLKLLQASDINTFCVQYTIKCCYCILRQEDAACFGNLLRDEALREKARELLFKKYSKNYIATTITELFL